MTNRKQEEILIVKGTEHPEERYPFNKPMRVLNDEEIHIAVTYGFGKKVKADNLTDEIKLKRHEAAKSVAQAQYDFDRKELVEWVKGHYALPFENS